MRKFTKKILLKIIIFFLSFISIVYFIEKLYDTIKYYQTTPKITNYDLINVKKPKQKNTLEDYVIINKNCTTCINNRKGNAGCVVSNNGKILLVRYRRTNQLSLPGGFRDYKHRDTFVASEEMRNALGYIVSIEDILGDFNYILSLSSDSNFRLYKCNILKKTNKNKFKNLLNFNYFIKYYLFFFIFTN